MNENKNKNERWLRKGHEKAIAFIHGIGAGDPERYWRQFTTVLQGDKRMEEFDIFVWKYPTDTKPSRVMNFLSSIKGRTIRVTAPRIKDLGQTWKATYQAQFGSYKEVILVCHSMGGLVVKSWIIDVLESGKSADLGRLRHISFYCTPHNGAPIAIIQWNKQLRDMKLNSNFILEVARHWNDHVVKWKGKKNMKIDRILYNRYIPHLVIAGLNDETVPESSADIKGMEMNKVFGDHSQAIQPDNADDTRYLTWRNSVEKILEMDSASLGMAEQAISSTQASIKKVKALKDAHNLLHSLESTLAVLVKEIQQQQRKKGLKYLSIGGIQKKDVEEKMEEIQALASSEAMDVLNEARFIFIEGNMVGPLWAKDLVEEHRNFLRNLNDFEKSSSAQFIEDSASSFLDKCRSHLLKIDGQLREATDQLDKHSDLFLRSISDDSA